jgi:hypothetical protein
MRSSALRLVMLVAASTVISACSDRDVSAPAVAGPTANRSLLLGSPTTVQVVTRNTAIATPQTATTVVGLLGGRLYLPQAGLSVIVPPLATKLGTRLTVTAIAGRALAYEFEPHGTRFLLPLIATQSLSGTSAVSNGLLSPSVTAAYFADRSDINLLGSTALVSELLGTTLSLVTNTATFTIFHFSGYLIATGKGSADGFDDTISSR